MQMLSIPMQLPADTARRFDDGDEQPPSSIPSTRWFRPA
jgi:hypothetical protein